MKGVGSRERGWGESFPDEPARERIERSAARLYAIRGFDGTSMREIAEAAGVTKPLVYYHFESKEALFGGLLLSAIDECHARLWAAGQAGDPRERLRDLLSTQVDLARREPEIYSFVHATLTMPRLLPLGFDYRGEGQKLLDPFRSVVREGQAAGMFRPIDPDLFVLTALAALEIYVADVLSGAREDIPQDLEESLYDLLMRGLEVSKA
ncbi:MAG: TetR/AcrR family transcriptional regulator [Candidatus Eisenbacteria bacterium]